MQVINFPGAGGAAHSRSVRVRHQKEKPWSGASQTKGSKQSQQVEPQSTLLATDQAIEARISELEAAKAAAAKSGDLATFKVLKADCDAALAMRLPATRARMEAERLAFVEHAKTLGDYGYYFVPADWLKSAEGQAAVLPPVLEKTGSRPRGWDNEGHIASKEASRDAA